jgi:DNA mismatch repair protein MutL
MAAIKVLDPNMVNMIAAGEVIERPASVVKELMENSIDAGATKIELQIEDGGRKLIRVTDDGCGMEPGDLELAFEPHATSKVSGPGDLAKICTMGFRGEALASIGAVAKVTVTSRTADSVQGNTVSIDCGQKQPLKPTGAAKGTTIEVADLFYKLPARRKFLRTANTEASHITEQFTRIALANRHFDLTLINNGRQIHRLTANQPLSLRITQLFNRALAEDLVETHSNERGLDVYALIGKPSAAKSTSKFQYTFLNGRFIRDKFITHAVKEAYRGTIDHSKYPVVFMFLELSPEKFDVNVHPGKLEVRFDNSNLIHSQVMAVIREKLMSANLDASGSFESSEQDSMNMGTLSPSDFQQGDNAAQGNNPRADQIRQAVADFYRDRGSEHSQPKLAFSESLNRPVSQNKKQDFYQKTHTPQKYSSSGENQSQQDTRPAIGPIQIHDSYILAPTEDGFMVIDQHALHERVIYEQLCRKLSQGSLTSQRLLIPATVDLNEAQSAAVKDAEMILQKLNIEIEPFGPNTVAVHTFPEILSKTEPEQFIVELLDLVSDKEVSPDPERLLHHVLDMAACKAAIKAGQKLSAVEISQLLEDKETLQRSSSCPHGRPTTIKFTLKDLEKQFKRT